MELLRVRFDEQARSEKRKSASTAIESGVTGNLTWAGTPGGSVAFATGATGQATMLASTNNVTPRNSWIVHAVLEKRGSSPFLFWTMLCSMPMSVRSSTP